MVIVSQQIRQNYPIGSGEWRVRVESETCNNVHGFVGFVPHQLPIFIHCSSSKLATLANQILEKKVKVNSTVSSSKTSANWSPAMTLAIEANQTWLSLRLNHVLKKSTRLDYSTSNMKY